jgi:lipid II:glycine glycyltransferase (peptidoglycan interpeptide bridge formation enzyme)
MNYLLEQVYFITDNVPWTEALKFFKYSDIYHSFEYVTLDSEKIGGVANLILVNMASGMVGLPVIFRKIPNETQYIDAVSVYGYNGVLTSPSITSDDFLVGIKKIKEAMAQRNCVSFFNRESSFTKYRLPDSAEIGKVVAVNLMQPPEVYEKSLTEGHRQEIRALRKMNYQVIKSCDLKTVEDFHHVYNKTMMRRGAKTHYLFTVKYFNSLLNIPSYNIQLRSVYHDNQMIAGAMFAARGDYIYYMFSGSVLGVSRYPAMKLVLDQVIRENLNTGRKLLHMGGGLGGKEDSLFKFKHGFGKLILPFYVTQWILLPEVYHQLSAGISNTDSFFPKYRSA